MKHKRQVSTTEAGSPPAKFSALHCESVSYEFAVSTDKFDLETFSDPFRPRFKDPIGPGLKISAVLSTRDSETVDYHVHLSWSVSRNQVRVCLNYVHGSHKPSENEKEPFAEDGMNWLGGFFKAKDAPAHIHASFEYPAEKWGPAIPLPLKVPIGSNPEVEVDGMSLGLGKNDVGMSQAWMISRESVTRILLYGNRSVEFSKFDAYGDARGLSDFARNFIKEKSNAADKF